MTITNKPGVVVLDVPVRWSDMDAYGHINNVAILRIMEDARVMVFGLPAGTGQPGGPEPVIDLNSAADADTMTLIADHTIRYRRQLPYRALPVRVELSIDSVKPVAVGLSYKIYDPAVAPNSEGNREDSGEAKQPQLCVTATSTMVFVSATTGAPLRVTPAQRTLLENFVAATDEMCGPNS